MYKVGVCGHFADGKSFNDGQTVKTKIIRDELSRVFGDIKTLDTCNWSKRPLKLVFAAQNTLKLCDNIILMPALNGLKILLPLFLAFNKFHKKRIHYVVIGGWLPQLAREKKWILYLLKKLHSIHVETHSMVAALSALGLPNVHYLPNFKRLPILSTPATAATTAAATTSATPVTTDVSTRAPAPATVATTAATAETSATAAPAAANTSTPTSDATLNALPLRVCTFSRVMKEKGIEDAIQAVTKINKRGTPLHLDIFGWMDPGYKADFENIMRGVPEFIKYKGVVDYSQAVETLKDYFLLLFPTYHEGEGFPGTLIDGFSAGVPSLVSDWKYNRELVEDGVNGFVFDLKDGMTEKLAQLVSRPETVTALKANCLLKAREFTPENAMRGLLRELGPG